jgi:CheY-like chemotaxis protein
MNSQMVKNVLLIDDNEINNVMHAELIKSSGFASNVIVKQSGLEALKYLGEEVTEATIPDVIFLDIRMPLMDGFGFLEEFKNLPHSVSGKSKIVILTSSLEETDHKKAVAHPFVVDYIIKPLSLSRLAAIKEFTFS